MFKDDELYLRSSQNRASNLIQKNVKGGSEQCLSEMMVRVFVSLFAVTILFATSNSSGK